MPDSTTDAAIVWRLTQLEKQVEQLENKVDKLTMAIVGSALTFSISIGVFAITILTTGGA